MNFTSKPSQDNFLQNIVLTVLFLIAALSTNLIILNEEILVAVSFLAFIVFCLQNAQSSVVEMLENRRLGIETELQHFLNLKEQYIQASVQDLKKGQHLHILVAQLNDMTANLIKDIQIHGQQSCQEQTKTLLVQKLKTLQVLGQGQQDRIQTSFQLGLRGAVLAKFQEKKKILQGKLLRQALSRLAGTSLTKPRISFADKAGQSNVNIQDKLGNDKSSSKTPALKIKK